AHVRVVLVRGAFNADLAGLVDTEPSPAAAEAGRGGLAERFFELVETTELGIDRFRQIAGWLAAAFGAHDGPEHRVVGMATAVVSHGSANFLGDFFDVAAEVLDALLRKVL